MRRFSLGLILLFCSGLALADETPSGDTQPSSTTVIKQDAPRSTESVRRISRLTVLGSAALLATGDLLLFNKNGSLAAEGAGSIFVLTGLGAAIIAPSAGSFYARRPGLGMAAIATRSLTFCGMFAAILPLALGEFRTPEEDARAHKAVVAVFLTGEAAISAMGLAEGALASKLLRRRSREVSLAPSITAGASPSIGASARLRW